MNNLKRITLNQVERRFEVELTTNFNLLRESLLIIALLKLSGLMSKINFYISFQTADMRVHDRMSTDVITAMSTGDRFSHVSDPQVKGRTY